MQMPDILEADITADDIKNGIPGDPCRCALALAVCRVFDLVPDDEAVYVEEGTIRVSDDDDRDEDGSIHIYAYELSMDAISFIVDFDYYKYSVEPFTDSFLKESDYYF